MIYAERKPEPALGDFVETLFHLKGYCPEHEMERIVPDTSISLVIELDDVQRWVLDNVTFEKTVECRESWVSGAQRHNLCITSPKGTELLAIRFRIGGMFALLGTQLDELTDQVIPAREVFGEAISTLRKNVIKANDSESKLDLVEHWLSDNMDFSLMPPKSIQAAIESIQRNPSLQSLQTVVEESGYSRKQFIHLFKKFTGLAPKDFQRILRFNQVLARIGENKKIEWAGLSMDCGYSDQSHFIKDFKNFSGLNPSKFIKVKGERENFFPVD